MLAASLHILEKRGITVSDLVRSGDNKDNAEKKIQDARHSGLLVPHQTIKSGKQKQYFLSNYIHLVNESANNNKDNAEVLPTDVTLLLAHELSNMKYVYHNIHLETALNFKKDYDLLRWSIPSPSNKQKVNSFKLEPHRSCSIVVSSTGNVNISIECTLAPYEFHTPEGLVNFFASCGQIWRILQTEIQNRLTVVPSIYEWLIQRFDYNKDISIKDLRGSHTPLTGISWTSRGLLKIKYLGTIFQIYSKELPEKGDHLRVEGHYSTKEKKNVVETVENIVVASDSTFTSSEDHNHHQPKDEKTTRNHRHPFITAEEMLYNNRKNMERNNQTV